VAGGLSGAKMSPLDTKMRLLMHAQADYIVRLGCSGRAQECSLSAQVRAATAQVQRRKWLLVRSRFVADYSGNNTPI